MNTFYKSDTGRSKTDKMSKVMSEVVPLCQQIMEGFTPKLQALFQEFREGFDRARESKWTFLEKIFTEANIAKPHERRLKT